MQPPIKTIRSRYNYAEAWYWLEQKGKELYGAKFCLYEDDKATIYLLLCYFLQDDIAAPELELELTKGVLVTGPVGCGKTTLLSLMRFLIPGNRFIVKSCRDISFEFIQEGYEVILRYSKGSLYHSMTRTFCFDDLGTENSLKYYGNECNVMAEILLSRYDLFITQKLKTHVTTNLSASEIEQQYGNRVRSRLREMFNLIAFDKNSPDKRK
jgi:energy-coupling factor transporter ATP-binding protein EcfA2